MRATLAAICLLALAGCSTDPEPSSASTSVSVPVEKLDKDPSYDVQGTASVQNDEFIEGVRTYVIIKAQSTDDDNRAPFFQGKLKMKNGEELDCKVSRSFIWSGSGYDDFNLVCDVEADTSNAVSFTLTP